MASMTSCNESEKSSADFDSASARKQMLEIITHPPLQELKIMNKEDASPKVEQFLNHFQQKIWPEFEKLKTLIVKASAVSTALDRALYHDENEKNEWKKLKETSTNQVQSITTSKEWQTKVKQWAEIANQHNLTGALADLARRMWEDIELGEFTEKEMPLLKRLTNLEIEIDDIANSSPFVTKLADAEKGVNDAIKAYFDKKLGFDETWKKIESYQKEGRTAHGQDIATKAKKLLHEGAKIRTELAKSKGFATWADYVMAVQARHYGPQFKKAQDRIGFLKKLLNVTKAPYVEFLKKQLKTRAPEIKLEQLRQSQLSLLKLEDDTLVREYFPKERIEAEWEKAMLASGFSPEKLKTIYLDGFPRKNKYTHAYMNSVTDHEPKVLSVDAKTLEVSVPEATTKDWYNSQIYIVQNFRDDGPDGWTTAFHEGGHALDYSYREDILGYGAAYGYVETHSMMMERFFDDVEYLVSVGRKKDGTPLTKELAEKFVRNSKINSLVNMRTQIAYALYDLELWNYSYSDTSEDFVTRANRLFGDLLEEARQAKGAVVENVDWRMSGFATSHFYSGDVRYFGYIVADMAAELSAQALWEKLEKTTNRRTFLNQPSLAAFIVEGYYKNGFLSEFPTSIEKFTGKPFAPEEFVQGIVKTIQEYEP